MSKLPAEILMSIADCLTFMGKLELAYACKTWYETLSPTNLYSNITFRNLEKLQQAIGLFNKNQYTKQSVRVLGHNNMEYDMELAVLLPALFPKITSLEWKDEGERRFKAKGSNNYKSIFAGALK